MATPAPASGLAFALGSATLYGLSIVYTRLASFEGVSGSALVVYRVLLMLVLALGAAALLRRSLAVPREERGVMAVLGVSSTAIGLAYLSSVAFIPVTVAVVIFYTFPAVIVLASPLVEGTRLTGALLGVAGLALLGVVLVVGPVFEGLDPRGIVLALVASLATATQFFAAARCRRTSTMAKLVWIHILILPAAAAIAWATGTLNPPGDLARAALPVAVTLGGYILGFALQIVALSRASAVLAGIAFCAEPVVAALSSAVVLDESLTPLQLVGGGLVLAAIVINVILEHRRAAEPVLTHPAADGLPS